MAKKTLPELTPWEKRVVKMLARGLTVPEIAVKIGWNLRTLETHVLWIRKACNSPTLAGVVGFCYENELIKPKKKKLIFRTL